jgi:Phage integrase family
MKQKSRKIIRRFTEKEIPVHHKLEEILDEYLKVSKLRDKPETSLFPTTLGESRELGYRPMTRFDGANLLKRRLRDAGIVGDYSPHSFRATGITNYLENGGTLEVAQRIAGHADSRTTKLYDRRGQKVLLEDMERNAELGILFLPERSEECQQPVVGFKFKLHLRLGLQGRFSEWVPSNGAAGVAIAMKQCSDRRQIGAYRATLHSRSHFDHFPSPPTVER